MSTGDETKTQLPVASDNDSAKRWAGRNLDQPASPRFGCGLSDRVFHNAASHRNLASSLGTITGTILGTMAARRSRNLMEHRKALLLGLTGAALGSLNSIFCLGWMRSRIKPGGALACS